MVGVAVAGLMDLAGGSLRTTVERGSEHDLPSGWMHIQTRSDRGGQTVLTSMRWYPLPDCGCSTPVEWRGWSQWPCCLEVQVPVLKELGRKHSRANVGAAHYDVMGRALVDTMAGPSAV